MGVDELVEARGGVTAPLAHVYLRGAAAPELRAAAVGLARRGLRVQVREQGAQCDLAVTWGAKPTRAELGRTGRRWLVLERGYVGDRHAWTSAGLGGLNGRAHFGPLSEVTADRFLAHHGHLLQPWRSGGQRALIMAQVPGDASLAGRDLGPWYEEQVRALREAGWEDVALRPHPTRPALAPRPRGCRVLRPMPMEEALRGAGIVVTYNSNSAVDAVLAGVPAVVQDRGSMAWDVSTRGVALPRWRGDRLPWASRLAWCQWSREELESGEFWTLVGERLEW